MELMVCPFCSLGPISSASLLLPLLSPPPTPRANASSLQNVDAVSIADTLPRKRHASTTNAFLSLPRDVTLRVYTHLPSRDCIALSRTCHQMYYFNALAYTHLVFLPPNS